MLKGIVSDRPGNELRIVHLRKSQQRVLVKCDSISDARLPEALRQSFRPEVHGWGLGLCRRLS